MQAKEYHTRRSEKEAWGPGPWVEEPDKMQWQDEATGYPCLIVRNHSGALCGYVGVPNGHPLYGKDYDDTGDLEVHGGITFADFCRPSAAEERGICHTVEPGEDDKVYWLGFDCNHADDLGPGMEAMLPGHIQKWSDFGAVYRDVPYVKAEIASLAKQLKEVEKNSIVTASESS